jgi:PAS domain-containing protein
MPAGAVAAVGLLSLVGWPDGVGPDVKYFLLIGAVLFSAIYGGLGPALFVTALSAFGMAFFSLAPFLSLEVASGPAHQRLMVFATEGVLLSVLGSVVRRNYQNRVRPFKALVFLASPLSVLVAMILKTLLFPQLARESPFVFNYAAVSVSAWLGGVASGGVATLACALLTRFYFLAPVHSLVVGDEAEAIRLGLFVSEGAVLSLLTGSHVALRRAVVDLTSRSQSYLKMVLQWREELEATRRVSRDILWEWNVENGEIQRLYGPQEPLSQFLPTREPFADWVERIHSGDRPGVTETLNRNLAEGRTELHYTYQILGPNGIYSQFSDHAFIVRNAAWKPVRVIGRSAHIESRASLRRVEPGQFERMFKRSPSAMLITDASLRVVTANSSARTLFRAQADELANPELLSFIDIAARPAAAEKFASLLRSDRLSICFESDLVRWDGEVFAGTVNAILITDFLPGSTGCLVTMDHYGGDELRS